MSRTFSVVWVTAQLSRPQRLASSIASANTVKHFCLIPGSGRIEPTSCLASSSLLTFTIQLLTEKDLEVENSILEASLCPYTPPDSSTTTTVTKAGTVGIYFFGRL